MNGGTLVLRSLRHYWRTNLAVALGAAVGCAVLAGALLVGTSIRGSLRDLTLERLGRIDFALVSNRYFDARLANALSSSSADRLAVPAILHSGSASHEQSGRRAANVNIIGIPSGFEPADQSREREGATPASDQSRDRKGATPSSDQSRDREGATQSSRDRGGAIAKESSAFSAQPLPDGRGSDQASREGATPTSDQSREREGAVARESSPSSAQPLPDGRGSVQMEHGSAFWHLGRTPPLVSLDDRRVVLNETLASDLGAKVGDVVLLRMSGYSAIPSESLLGRRDRAVRTLRAEVAAVIPDQGLGRFTLQVTQQTPRNIYVDLSRLQRRLDLPGQVNTVLITGDSAAPEPLREAVRAAATLEDLGLRLVRHAIETADGNAFEYAAIESTQMVLSAQVEQAVMQAAGDAGAIASPVLTYLANTIRSHDAPADAPLVPYSVVAAVDLPPPAPFPPMAAVASAASRPAIATSQASAADPPIVFNQWLADRLDAAVGQRFDLTYYMLDPGGLLRTELRTFRLQRIVELSGSAADPSLTPEYPGISQARTMSDWDPPFPVDYKRVGKADEQYWEQHRATPKAFIPLAVGQELWASERDAGARFGRLTSIRLAAPVGESLDDLLGRFTSRLRQILDPAAAGLILRPVKRESLEASGGATDFGGLFIGFSMFLIASAALLVVLLFRLAVEQRARQIGLLRAVGLTVARIRRILAVEGFILAVVGGLVGAAAAVGYAWLMVAGLRTLWRSAVGTSRLSLHVSLVDLAMGTSISIALAAVSVLWAVRIAGSRPIVAMLAGAVAGELTPVDKRRKSPGAIRRRLAIAGAVAAVVLLATSWFVAGTTRAGLFFGGGALLLAAALTGLSVWIAAGFGGAVAPGPFAIARLAIRNAARRSDRSTLTVSLVACATFLVVAVAASRHEPEFDPTNRDSGHGGFALIARSDVPILTDLNRAICDGELVADPALRAALADIRVFPLRSRPGDDASCLNLYKPRQPALLGVTDELIDRGGFAFAATLADDEQTRSDPWRLLRRDLGEGVVPVFADANTATWLLKLGLGDELTVRDDRGGPLRLRLVGTLSRSIFQSELVLSEQQFLAHFPLTNGYGAFLIDVPAGGADTAERADSVATVLDSALADHGFDAVRTSRRLAAFMAVESTYLSTFQMLGGLGLLLGTFGIAVVLLRNVLERRGELTLLSAVGFRRSAVRHLILLETASLIALGLLVGAATALVAVAPNAIDSPGRIPWLSLAGTLALILVIGVVAAALAARSAVRGDLIESLRAG